MRAILSLAEGCVGAILLRQIGSAGAESVTARSSEVESPACRRKNEELDDTIMVTLCCSIFLSVVIYICSEQVVGLTGISSIMHGRSAD